MDIGLLVAQQPRVTQPKTPIQGTSTESSSSFDKVFSETIQTSKDTGVAPVNTQSQEMTTEEAVEAVTEVLETTDAESLFAALGIEVDANAAFVQIDGELIPVEELMNVEDLTAALGITPEQLQQIVENLLGEEMPEADVWQLLEQTPAILAQITAVLQGESTTITPKEAVKVVEFLKLAQVVGLQTDTVYKQEFQLKETKANLQTLLTQLKSMEPPKEAKVTFEQVLQTAQKLPIEDVQPKLQVTQTQVQQTTQQTQVQATPQSQQQQVQQTVQATQQEAQPAVAPTTQLVQTKTVTITLPTTPTAQPEALVKEIESALSRSQFSNTQGQMKLLLKLYPENLGQIRIELFQKDGVMQARLLATSGQTKDLLDSNLNQLKTALAGQNIQLDRLDVAQALQSTEQSSRDQNFFNNFFRQQQEEQADEQGDNEEEQSFEEFLQQQLEAEEVKA